MRLPWFLNPFIGMIAEKTATRYFIIVTPAITAIPMSLLGLAPSFTIVCVLLFTMGISSAVFHVPAPTMVKRLSGNRTGLGMARPRKNLPDFFLLCAWSNSFCVVVERGLKSLRGYELTGLRVKGLGCT